jgi:hypothetical protein
MREAARRAGNDDGARARFGLPVSVCDGGASFDLELPMPAMRALDEEPHFRTGTLLEMRRLLTGGWSGQGATKRARTQIRMELPLRGDER